MVLLAANFSVPLASAASLNGLNGRPSVSFEQDAQLLTFDASDMTDLDGLVTYRWSLVGRPFASAAVIRGAAAPVAFVQVDVPGQYTIELARTVDGVVQPPISLVATTDNLEPVAAIGAEGGHAPVSPGMPVRLTGAGSYDQFPDGELSFRWTFSSLPAGSAAVFDNPLGLRAAFTPDLPGEYEVTLTVSDPDGLEATDTIRLATGQGLASASAGADVPVTAGEPVLIDAFGSTHSAGVPLLAAWSVVSRPPGSLADLESGGSIDPPQPGRHQLTPDVDGLYVLRADLSEGGSAAADTVIVAVNANVRPIAEAGADRVIATGAQALLDATGSTDANGDNLAVRWDLIHAPAGSAAVILHADQPKATLTTDMAGDYLVQLSVSDGASTSRDTVLLTSGFVSPVARAGRDAVLPKSGVVQLDGTRSAGVSRFPLDGMWSISNLADARAATLGDIVRPDALAASAEFAIDPAGYYNPARGLSDYNLVVFQNALMRSQVHGAAFVGGQLNGQSAGFGYGLGSDAGGEVILTVGGHINGNPKTVTNGGSVRAGLAPNAHINFEGGGEMIIDPTVDVAPLQAELEAFSVQLREEAPTSVVSLPAAQPLAVTFNAVPNADGVAVFDISDGNDLFDDSKVRSIDISMNGAEAVVINVGGKNVKVRQANFVGAFESDLVRGRVLWNFHGASNVNIDREFSGSLLAPGAMVHVNARMTGAVVARQLIQRAAIAMPVFTGAPAFAEVPDPVTAAVLQLRVDDNGYSDVDTLLATTANIAPIADIDVSAADVNVGTLVSLSAASSADANGDALEARWSLVMRPAGSAATIIGAGDTVSLTPDRRGTYVAQLIVHDGALASAPATLAIVAANRPPVITSTPVGEGIEGEPYLYTAQADDPDGDSLAWALVRAPAGMSVSSTSGEISWTPDEPGSFDVALRVSDGYGGIDLQSFTIVVSPATLINPPVVSAIGDLTVRPGETVTVAVAASDPDGDTLSFWAPALPPGASLDAKTGIFEFSAVAEAPAQHPVTIIVSDGILTTSVNFNVIVVGWPETDPTLFSGRVLDAQDFANGLETPVTGAAVTLNGVSVTTAADGGFAFSALAAAQVGEQIVLADGTAATPPAVGGVYGAASRRVRIYEHAPNLLAAPLLLSRFNGEGVVATEIDDDLPPNLRTCSITRYESADGSAIPLAALALVAPDTVAPGTAMTIWSRAESAATYAAAGSATVGADGTTLENVVGTVASGSGVFVTPLALSGQESALQPFDSYVPSLLGEGNMQTGFSLPSYSSLGQNRAPSFLYNSVAANPRPIVTADITIPARAALTGTLEAELYVNGQKAPGVTVIDLTTAENPASALPVEDTDAAVSVSVSFDGSAFATGAYPYELYVFAGGTCAAAAARTEGRVFVNNRSSTPYGSGWKPTELQTLVTQPDGSVLIEEADGGLSLFEVGNAVESFDKLSLRYDIEGGHAASVGDLNGDGRLDFVTAASNSGDVVVFLNEGGVDFQRAHDLPLADPVVAPTDPQVVYTPEITDLTLGDVSGDGILDLVVSRQFNGGISVALGRGDGSFGTFSSATAGSGTYNSVKIADVDGDRVADIVGLSAYIGFYATPHVILNDRNGGFEPPIIVHTTPQRHTRFNVIDLDDDGDSDIVLDGARALLNDGSANFDERQFKLFGTVELLNPVADVTRIRGFDGVVSVSLGSDQIGIAVFDRVTRRFNAAQTIPLPSPALRGAGVRFVDLNGDGLDDILLNEGGGSSLAYAIYATADGDFGGLNLLPIGHPLFEVRAADFDDDGASDLLSVDRYDIFLDYGNATGAENIRVPFGDFSALARDAGGFVRRYKDGTEIAFDEFGRQTSVTDANGNVTAYAYDADGRLVSITDPVGEQTLYTYLGGRLASVTSPDGRVTTFEYDASGRMIALEEPDSSQQLFSYDANGRLVSETDKRGFETTHLYGAAGRFLASTYPDGASNAISAARSLGLDSLGGDTGTFVSPEDRITTVADARGNESVMEVNQWGGVVRRVDPLGREYRFERNEDNLVVTAFVPLDGANAGFRETGFAYDSDGNLVEQTDAVGAGEERTQRWVYGTEFSRLVEKIDAGGFTTTYDYDARGNLLTETDPNGGVTAHTYNERGQKLTTTDRRGNVTTVTYDARGLLGTLTDPAGFATRHVYDLAGNLRLQIRGEGTPEEQRVSYEYDPLNRVTRMLNGEAEITEYGYDTAGNPVLVRDATGIEASRSYDSRNRLTSVADPASGTTVMGYDADNNLTSVIASDGTATAMTYDAVNRVTDTTDALGITRRVAYDARDNAIAITDGRGNTTTFEYDLLDRVTARTNPLGNRWGFGYDARGLRTSTAKPDGRSLAFGYDNLQRLTIVIADGRFIQRRYAYDAEGNLTAMGTGGGFGWGFEYDARNQIISSAEPRVDSIYANISGLTYAYDAHGRRVSMSQPAARAETLYAWDKADRLVTVTGPSGKAISLGYDGAGRRSSIAFPNGLTTELSFQTPFAAAPGTTGRLASIAHGLDAAGQTGTALNGLLGTFSYGYDVKGNITGIAESGTPARTRNYALDAIERLTAVTDGGGGPLESYTLDEEGNRIVSHLSSFHVTDSANRLTEDAGHAYEYDVNGNLVRKTVKASGETWRYGYSVFDELVRATKHASPDPAAPPVLTKRWDYDPLGRRAREYGPSGNRVFHHDGEQVAMEWTFASGLRSRAIRWYTHSDVTDDLLAITGLDPAADTFVNRGLLPAGTSYYAHTDHQGSVRAVTDDAGTVINEYSYDSYGNAETAVESLPQLFRYTAREYDPETGLYHYRARTYDPATGRFLQEDPIWFAAGDLNIYRYVWNSPVNWVDPTGLSPSNEQTQTSGIGLRAMGAVAMTGDRVNCLFGIAASAIAAIDAVQTGDGGDIVETAVLMGETAMECGFKVRAKARPGNRCTGPGSGGGFRQAALTLGRMIGNSFTEGTPVLTRAGFRPIEEIQVGEEIGAIDEKTGERVWRKVVERLSRQAPEVLQITVEDAAGNRNTITATPEHPFHVEDWDGSVETVVAILNGTDGLPAHMLMPSDGKTRFGDWVKAGALKRGDRISTLFSVGPTVENAKSLDAARESRPIGGDALSALKAANDNEPVTVREILRDQDAARVYNFEIESLPGEITHNYMVGDDALWVHNATKHPRLPGRVLRRLWEQYWQQPWPLDESGRNQDACHIIALADGGNNSPTNITPMPRRDHVRQHIANGDFRRWGKRAHGGTD